LATSSSQGLRITWHSSRHVKSICLAAFHHQGNSICLAAFYGQVNSVILAKQMFERTRKIKIMDWQAEFNIDPNWII